MSHLGRRSSRRVLVVMTVTDPGPVQLPFWIKRFGACDIFVLNPRGVAVLPPEDVSIGETFLFTDPTGLESGLDQSSYLFRSQNEVLRRSFRDLLRWGKWDTLVLDGLKSVAPLIGSGGIDLPRSLATMIYCERPEDLEIISPKLEWYQFGEKMIRRRLKKWHESIIMKSIEVIRDEGSHPHPQIDGAEISP